MAHGPVEALLGETFGIKLLTYLCAISVEEMETRLDSGNALVPQAEAVLAELAAFAQIVAAQQTANPGLPAVVALQPLGQFDPASGTTVANRLRLEAGGDLLEASMGGAADDDLVKSLLFTMARDAYPMCLAPSDVRFPMSLTSLYQHPARAELDTAITEDPALSRLFPEDEVGLGHRGTVYTSLGRGSSIHTVLFGSTIVAAAWDAATMDSETPSLAELLAVVNTLVDVIREAAGGKQPGVRARLVFTGLVTANGATIETPWGPLRPLTEIERRAAPTQLEGTVSGTDPDGKSVTVSYAGELVLETTLPYGVVVKPSAAMEVSAQAFPQVPGADALTHRIEAIQLSALLGVQRPVGSWAIARLAWYWVADPLFPGRMLSWASVQSAPGFMPYELSASECESLADWCRWIEERRVPQVDIAVRRVLSAAHSRTTATDRLVDAVIAWENLFGTSEGEPRLRITAAMAWLLGNDRSSRQAIQATLKKLYDDRSKIVHGATFEERAMNERGGEALTFSLRSLEVLFRDRPDILALRDGAERSLALILGGSG
jgi:hypothetical protein